MSTRATAAYRYLSFKGGGTVAKQLMWSQETCGLVGPLPSDRRAGLCESLHLSSTNV